MKRLLLENARKIHLNASSREASRREIENAVYFHRTLWTADAFFNLVWMDTENILGAELYNQLTPKEEPRTLKNLVRKIRNRYPRDSPHEILSMLNSELSSLREVEQYRGTANTSANNKWFEGCVTINGTFDPRLIRDLWVRDLLKHESKQSPMGIYYIEDGSHRALVYALNLALNETAYVPVKVRWCQSWKHIFSWAQEPDTRTTTQKARDRFKERRRHRRGESPAEQTPQEKETGD